MDGLTRIMRGLREALTDRERLHFSGADVGRSVRSASDETIGILMGATSVLVDEKTDEYTHGYLTALYHVVGAAYLDNLAKAWKEEEMKLYEFEVTTTGRVRVGVRAESEEEAREVIERGTGDVAYESAAEYSFDEIRYLVSEEEDA